LAAFIITRIQTGDYEKWRPLFNQDKPRAREKAVVERVLRSTEDGDEVFIYLEFSNLEDAQEARDRLVSSGVLERFADVYGPRVLVDAG
jgi:ribosomal protein L21E